VIVRNDPKSSSDNKNDTLSDHLTITVLRIGLEKDDNDPKTDSDVCE
jgi:hypothetical protein